jgi:hypothetical protein
LCPGARRHSQTGRTGQCICPVGSNRCDDCKAGLCDRHITALAVTDHLKGMTGRTSPVIQDMATADNATGNFVRVVQRVPVKIRLVGNPLPGRLVPGLSARVAVDGGSGS